MSSKTATTLPKGKKRNIEEVETSPGKASKKSKADADQDLHNRYRNIEDFSEADWSTESEADSAEHISDEGSVDDDENLTLHWTVQQRLDEITDMLHDRRLTHWYLKMIAEGLGTWCRGGRNADIVEGLIGHVEYLAQNGSRLRDELSVLRGVCEMFSGGGCAFDDEEDVEGEEDADGYGDEDEDDDDDDEDDDDEDDDTEDEDFSDSDVAEE